jgi:hypothetical protein
MKKWGLAAIPVFLCLGILVVQAAQTNYVGTFFLADPTTLTNQLKVNSDGSINTNSGSSSEPSIPGPTTATSTNGGAQAAFSTNTITTTNTYQQVVAAGSCTHGGVFTNLSTVGAAAIYLDYSTGITVGGTTLGNGAVPVGTPAVAPSGGGSGGVLSIPPTSNAVMAYGPSGGVFHGSCS